jgi:gluconate 2-dehydrogenase gamma chain
MQRRDVLKLLGSTAALSALPQEALALLQQANAQAGGAKRGTLNPHQDATVTTIAELIIPATDTPGAKGAKVNEFIDLLLTQWYEPKEAQEFLKGLAEVDARSRKLFAKDFVAATPEQQTQLMKTMDGEAMEFAARQRKMVAKSTMPPLEQTKPVPVNFFYTMKKLTLTGYYTSEIGFEKELGRTIIPPGHAGCAPLTEVSR